MQINHPTGPSPTQLVMIYHVVHRQTLQRGPGHFFELISCSMALSKLSSATSFFNRLFSVLQLLELAYLIRLKACVLILPPVKRLLGYPRLAGQIRYRHPKLRLLENRHDLLDRKSFPLHGKLLDRLSVSLPEN
jgi:hypothetical protein